MMGPENGCRLIPDQRNGQGKIRKFPKIRGRGLPDRLQVSQHLRGKVIFRKVVAPEL